MQRGGSRILPAHARLQQRQRLVLSRVWTSKRLAAAGGPRRPLGLDLALRAGVLRAFPGLEAATMAQVTEGVGLDVMPPLAWLGQSLATSGSIEEIVQQQLAGLSPLTFAIVFGAGLLTSLSPCTLSVLPLTIGYIGGYSSGSPDETAPGLVARATAFAFGLATTLALLGVFSTYLGRTYGQIGNGLPLAVSIVAIVMGLNLLEVIQLQLPSLDVDVRRLSAPPLLQAYLAGLTFALAASPCSTPVLATLLAYVSTTEDPLLGGGLLLAYTSGYVGPLLLAATFTGALKQVLGLRQWSSWITPASGVLLLAGGTYGLLSRTFPA